MRFARTIFTTPEVELPPEVWTSTDVERRLAPLYTRLRLPEGRLELMTGIRERRFWPTAIRPSEASAAAGRKAMHSAGVGPQAIDLLIHCSVCRDRLEPATAAYIHGLLGLGAQTQILDISNACLGFANALVLAAGLVESGQIRCALICAGEDGRPLVEHTLRTLNDDLTLTRESIKPYFANLTIGAGAAAALVMRDDIAPAGGFRLLAAAAATDSAANRLCEGDTAASELAMRTDSEALLHAGVALAATCWQSFEEVSGWTAQTPDRVVTHQVGRRHAALLYERLGLAMSKDCPSLETLGNVGSVSLPATLGLARADGRIAPGHRVALLGIGSGLSSLMLAAEAL